MYTKLEEVPYTIGWYEALPRRLFHNEIILDGFNPFDAPGDLAGFIDGLLRINEAAQLHRTLEGFDADLK